MSSSQAVAVPVLQDHITATRDVEGACAKWRQDMSVRYGSGQTVWPTVVKMTAEAHQALLDQLTPMLVTGFSCPKENPHGRILSMKIVLV